MKTVIYCRVGNKSQTIEGQKELCIQALDQGDELVKVFENIGFSGLGADRPMLQQLMKEASENTFKKAVVSEPSRLFRDTSKLLEFKNGLEQLGIELKFAKYSSDTLLTAEMHEAIKKSVFEE